MNPFLSPSTALKASLREKGLLENNYLINSASYSPLIYLFINCLNNHYVSSVKLLKPYKLLGSAGSLLFIRSQYSYENGRIALVNSEYLSNPSWSLSSLLKYKLSSSEDGQIAMLLRAVQKSSLEQQPYCFSSKTLKASYKLKSGFKDN